MGVGKATFFAALAILSYGIYVNVNKPVEQARLLNQLLNDFYF